jgi:type VI secretion system protein ImpH
MDAVCGSFAWENQTKFRVYLGPIGYEEFLFFLPSGKKLKPVFSLIRFMVGIEYEFEVCLVLKRREVPSCVIGTEGRGAARLGWTTWIKSSEFTHREDPYVAFQESLV